MCTRNMARAYSYGRHSTALQAQGNSLPRQTEFSTAYAAKHGVSLDTFLTYFDKGVSGFTGAIRAKGALAASCMPSKPATVSRWHTKPACRSTLHPPQPLS
jgi:hypothetical protein